MSDKGLARMYSRVELFFHLFLINEEAAYPTSEFFLIAICANGRSPPLRRKVEPLHAAATCYLTPKEFGNMKNKLMRLHDKLLSRQRSIIETINDQLKNISQIEHSRHRLRS